VNRNLTTENDFFWVSNPLCLSSSSTLHFCQLFFLVHHLDNRDDQHLLAHAMASDFSVAWQCSQREQLFFRYGSNATPRTTTLNLPVFQIYRAGANPTIVSYNASAVKIYYAKRSLVRFDFLKTLYYNAGVVDVNAENSEDWLQIL
jgi:hypothetical protein